MNLNASACMAMLALGLCGLPHAAMSADSLAPTKAPRTVLKDWTGFYAGINAGYSWDVGSSSRSAITNSNYPTAFANNGIPASSDVSTNGFLGGIHGGYNFQTGHIVFGIEADVAYSGMRGSRTSAGLSSPSIGGVTITTAEDKKLEWFGTLRGRIGALATPSMLVYATGGLAYGKVSSSTTTSVPEAAFTGGCSGAFAGNFFCSTGSFSGWRTGWTIGAGVETPLGDKWSAKAEYLYYDLGQVSYTNYSTISLPGTAVMQTNTRFDGHIVRLGLSYRFN